MKFARYLFRIRIVIVLFIITVALIIMLSIRYSTINLTVHNGFQNYETGKIYILGCRLTPSRLFTGNITKVELKNPSGNSIISNDQLFNSECYWDSKAIIGAVTTSSDEIGTLGLLPLSNRPTRDRDGNYALVISISPIKDFDSKVYKDYYFEIEYKVLGFPRTLKYMPFN